MKILPKQRIFAFLMALTMVFSLLPTSVFAEEGTTTVCEHTVGGVPGWDSQEHWIVCGACGQKTSVEAHTPLQHPAVAPTSCGVSGNVEYYECTSTICGALSATADFATLAESESAFVDTLEHTLAAADGTVTWVPLFDKHVARCVECGYTDFTCNPQDHSTFVYVEQVDPTYTTTGVIAHYKCPDCGGKYDTATYTTDTIWYEDYQMVIPMLTDDNSGGSSGGGTCNCEDFCKADALNEDCPVCVSGNANCNYNCGHGRDYEDDDCGQCFSMWVDSFYREDVFVNATAESVIAEVEHFRSWYNKLPDEQLSYVTETAYANLLDMEEQVAAYQNGSGGGDTHTCEEGHVYPSTLDACDICDFIGRVEALPTPDAQGNVTLTDEEKETVLAMQAEYKEKFWEGERYKQFDEATIQKMMALIEAAGGTVNDPGTTCEHGYPSATCKVCLLTSNLQGDPAYASLDDFKAVELGPGTNKAAILNGVAELNAIILVLSETEKAEVMEECDNYEAFLEIAAYAATRKACAATDVHTYAAALEACDICGFISRVEALHQTDDDGNVVVPEANKQTVLDLQTEFRETFVASGRNKQFDAEVFIPKFSAMIEAAGGTVSEPCEHGLDYEVRTVEPYVYLVNETCANCSHQGSMIFTYDDDYGEVSVQLNNWLGEDPVVQLYKGDVLQEGTTITTPGEYKYIVAIGDTEVYVSVNVVHCHTYAYTQLDDASISRECTAEDCDSAGSVTFVYYPDVKMVTAECDGDWFIVNPEAEVTMDDGTEVHPYFINQPGKYTAVYEAHGQTWTLKFEVKHICVFNFSSVVQAGDVATLTRTCDAGDDIVCGYEEATAKLVLNRSTWTVSAEYSDNWGSNQMALQYYSSTDEYVGMEAPSDPGAYYALVNVQKYNGETTENIPLRLDYTIDHTHTTEYNVVDAVVVESCIENGCIHTASASLSVVNGEAVVTYLGDWLGHDLTISYRDASGNELSGAPQADGTYTAIATFDEYTCAQVDFTIGEAAPHVHKVVHTLNEANKAIAGTCSCGINSYITFSYDANTYTGTIVESSWLGETPVLELYKGDVLQNGTTIKSAGTYTFKMIADGFTYTEEVTVDVYCVDHTYVGGFDDIGLHYHACSVCDKAADAFTVTYVAEQPATVTAKGVMAHFKCSCGQLFKPENGNTDPSQCIADSTHEVTMNDLLIDKLPCNHEPNDGYLPYPGGHRQTCKHCTVDINEEPHAYELEVADEKFLVTAATCTEAATYYKSCVCGEKGTETFSFGPVAAASYQYAIDENYPNVIVETCKYCDHEAKLAVAYNKTYNSPVVDRSENWKDNTSAIRPVFYQNGTEIPNGGSPAACGAYEVRLTIHGVTAVQAFETHVYTYTPAADNAAVITRVCECGESSATATLEYNEEHKCFELVYSDDIWYGKEQPLEVTITRDGEAVTDGDFTTSGTYVAVFKDNVNNLTWELTHTIGEAAPHVHKVKHELDEANKAIAGTCSCGINSYITFYYNQYTYEGKIVESSWLGETPVLELYKGDVLQDGTTIKSAGTYTFKMIADGLTYTEEVVVSVYCEEHTHEYGFDDIGLHYHKCSVCDAGTRFTVEYVAEQAATLLAPGMQAHFKCSCGELFKSVDGNTNPLLCGTSSWDAVTVEELTIPKLSCDVHTPKDGYEVNDEGHYQICDVCGDHINAGSHAYGQVVADAYKATAATCTAKATYYKSCVCGVKGTETFESGEMLAHVYNKEVVAEGYLATAATCTAKATYYKSCECGAKGTETFETGEVLAHVYDKEVATEGYLATAASCIAKATYYKSCECGAKGTETFAVGEVLPHVYNMEAVAECYLATPATCTTKATFYKSCECGAKGTETFEAGDVKAHVYDKEVVAEGYLATAATCTAKATYYKSCECGAKGTETFATGEMLAHVYDKEVVAEGYLATAATCTAKATYYKSCVCGAKGTETFATGNMLAHTYTYTNNNAASITRTCDCGKTDTATLSYVADWGCFGLNYSDNDTWYGREEMAYLVVKHDGVVVENGNLTAPGTYVAVFTDPVNNLKWEASKEIGHECSYVYSAAGAVITETCSVYQYCPHKETATITYAGEKQAATVAYSGNWKGNTLTIAYKDASGAAVSGTPVDEGTYTASITKENATANATAKVSHEHGYTYTASGAVLTQTCTKGIPCGHVKTATVIYPGEKKPATVNYQEGWVGDPLTIVYKDGSGATVSGTPATEGTYTANITVGGVTAFAEGKVDHECDYTYTGSGAVITETCAGCSHVKTATIAYEGNQKPAAVTYDTGWKGGDLTIVYTDDQNKVLTGVPMTEGTYTATITKGSAKASAQGKIDHAHVFSYAAKGNVLTETCAAPKSCGHSQTAELVFDAQTKTVSVTYTDDWAAGELTISYKQGTSALTAAPTTEGTYIASITKGSGTANLVFTIPHTHVYTYTAKDNVLTEACTGTIPCGHVKTAVITYAGKKAAAVVTYSENWQAGNLDIVYTNEDTGATVSGAPQTEGTYIASITKDDATAKATGEVAHECSYEYSVADGKFVETCSGCQKTATATPIYDYNTMKGGATCSDGWSDEALITYTYKQGATVLAAAPEKSGTYTVTATLDGKYIDVEFTIAEVKASVPKQADSNSEIDLTAAAITGAGTLATDHAPEGTADANTTVAVTVEVAMDYHNPNDADQVADVEAMKEEMDEQNLEAIEITVSKTTATTTDGKTETSDPEEIPDTVTVLELAIPFNFAGKTNVRVYRTHEGNAEGFDELTYRPSFGDINFSDKHFYCDREHNTVYVYTRYFSSYGIASDPAKDVSFLDDDGTSSMAETQHVEVGEALTSLPNPTKTREGHTFAGWFTAPTGGTRVTSIGSVTDNVTLYAHWTADSYEVKLNNDGVVTTLGTVTYGGEYPTINDPAPKTGYTFAGWFTAETGGTQIQEGDTVQITAPTTLYARWTADSYKLSFVVNGGNESPADTTVTFGSAYGELPTVTKDGHDLKGWYTAETDGTKVTATTVVDTTGARTLYARWAPKTFTVTFDTNGGGTAPAAKTVTYGGTYGELAEVTRTGYKFDGWYTAATGGTKVEADTVVNITADTTLYAQWTAKTVKVNYNANGGKETNIASAELPYGGTYGTLPTVTRDGYTLAGWFTAASGGTAVTANDTVANEAEHTLYAQWTMVRHSVTLVLNDGTNNTETVSLGIDDKLPVLTREGYIHTGWVDANGNSVEKITGPATITAVWTAGSYKMTEGDDQSAAQGKEMSFKTNADFSLFAGVKVDGNLLDQANYTVKEGSIIVTLSAAYTKTLAAGPHTLAIVLSGGAEVRAEFTVTAAEPQPVKVLVSFDANGGLTTPNDITVTVGEAYGKLPTITHSSLYFAGWYTAKEGGKKVSAYTTVETTTDHTLYARWSTVPVTGDNTDMGTVALLTGALTLSLAGLAAILIYRKRRC